MTTEIIEDFFLPLFTFAIIIAMVTIFTFAIAPHAETCECNIKCVRYRCSENGVSLYEKSNENGLFYWNEALNKYVKIIQDDGTPYTYYEYTTKKIEGIGK